MRCRRVVRRLVWAGQRGAACTVLMGVLAHRVARRAVPLIVRYCRYYETEQLMEMD